MDSVVMVQGMHDELRALHAARLSAASRTTLVTSSGVRPEPERDIARALEADRSLVIDVPSAVDPRHVVALAADAQHELGAIETVVDARMLLRLLGLDGRQACDCWRAQRLVEQLEQSTMVTIMRWHPLATADLSMLMALVSHLAPRTRLRLDRGVVEAPAMAAIEREHDRAGWTAVLNDGHDPHMTDPRVAALRFDDLRPFHPERLRAALETLGAGRHGTLVRSAGFMCLASRPGRMALWDQAGGAIDLHPLPEPEPGALPVALGQELALIGVDLDRAAIAALLDGATLHHDELAAGPEAWSRLADPFPEWHAHAH